MGLSICEPEVVRFYWLMGVLESLVCSGRLDAIARLQNPICNLSTDSKGAEIFSYRNI